MPDFAENFAHMMRGMVLMYYITRCILLCPRRRENAVLSFMLWLFASLAVILIVGMVFLIDGMWDSRYVVNLSLALDMCLVPLLAAFMLKIIIPRRINPATVTVMLLPSVVLGVIYAITRNDGVYKGMFVYTALLVAIGLTLILLSVHYYNNYLKDNFSDVENRSVSWVSRSVLYFVGWYVVWTFFLGWSNSWWMYSAYFAFMLVIWPFIYRHAARHMTVAEMPDVFTPAESEETVSADSDTTAEDTVTASYDKDNEIMEKIEKAMSEDKLFKTPDLSLDLLADSRNQISKALHRRAGQNFYTYVNGYRVNEAIHIMSDSNADDLTIDAIASESGFNDRKSFHRIFKNVMKTSPSDYRKTKAN